MPELPEVETTVRGIKPYLEGRRISAAVVRDARLRWQVPSNLNHLVAGKAVRSVRRRAKYILIDLGDGHLLIHLGMSGSLRLTSPGEPAAKHDHVEFQIDDERVLRFHDTRRFGCVTWIEGKPDDCQLLAHLGVEPLTEAMSGVYLYSEARGRKTAVKNLIMNSRIVVGVGNIYASEALFRAGIHPARAAGRISLRRYTGLADAIRQTLSDAIRVGGTTLRDFVDSSGNPGYFRQNLTVYERGGKPCVRCASQIQRKLIGQRATYFCRRCQT